MTRTISALLVAALVLSSCGFRDSRLNPLNWFGRAQSVETTEATGPQNPLIPRTRRGLRRGPVAYAGQPIDRVTDLKIERLPGGAIVRATGIADRQGPYEVRLIEDEAASDGQTVVYVFSVVTPRGAVAGGSETSRTVTVATYLTDRQLESIRAIKVEGRQNTQVTRRR
jgi:hypothetical protein